MKNIIWSLDHLILLLQYYNCLLKSQCIRIMATIGNFDTTKRKTIHHNYFDISKTIFLNCNLDLCCSTKMKYIEGTWWISNYRRTATYVMKFNFFKMYRVIYNKSPEEKKYMFGMSNKMKLQKLLDISC